MGPRTGIESDLAPPDEVIRAIARAGEVVFHSSDRAQEGRTRPWPDALDPQVVKRLRASGVEAPWVFQAQAIERLLAGEDTALAGGTGSGKSLCYQAPLAQILSRDRRATALYLAPTKALAQDQARRMCELGLTALRPRLYDGDTAAPERRSIRTAGRLVLTNPDMLNSGILPRHGDWSRFLAHLAMVVIDEGHIYRGVFGSHVAQTLRRLMRITDRYGCRPVIVYASATSRAAGEHAALLTGRTPFGVIGDDGSPRSQRTLMLWNPRLLDEQDDESLDDGVEGLSVGDAGHSQSRRASALGDAAVMVAELLMHDASVICFTRTRTACELVASFISDRLGERGADHLANLVEPYRAGYTAEVRREIEAKLASGELRCVVATSALEMGIDIGSLDVAVSVSYPGSVTSLHQQWGRAGRGERSATGVLIAGHDALDQYFAGEPAALLNRAVEQAVISLSNERIVLPHILAAACEFPLTEAELEAMDPSIVNAVGEQVRNEVLRDSPRGLIYTGQDSPAHGIDLRSVRGGSFIIIDGDSGELIGHADQDRVMRSLYPGAVYLHRMSRMLVSNLDLESGIVHITEQPVPYFTQPKIDTQIEVVSELRTRDLGSGIELVQGRVAVREQLTSFVRRDRESHDVIDTVECALPPMVFTTEAVWFSPPPGVLDQLEPRDILGALHAAEHGLIGLLPLFAMCDRADIGGLSTNWHAHTAQSTIFIYDGHEGGVGIAAAGWERFEEWVGDTTHVLERCLCQAGCPSCIQSPKCGNLNEPLHKQGALSVLRSLL